MFLHTLGRLLPIATGSNGAVSASASLSPAGQVGCKRVVSINAIAWSDECNFAVEVPSGDLSFRHTASA